MSKFKETLDALRLRELRLTGRKFTWSNAQANPALTRIDCFFSTDEWDIMFPAAIFHPLPSAISNRAPLLLVGSVNFQKSSAFCFKAFWTHMEGFQKVVTSAWDKPSIMTSATRRLHAKLARVAKALKVWHMRNFNDLHKA
jgi:hypothetical protein